MKSLMLLLVPQLEMLYLVPLSINTFITWAVWYGHLPVVHELLAAGAARDVNGCTAKGETAIMFAAYRNLPEVRLRDRTQFVLVCLTRGWMDGWMDGWIDGWM